MALLFGDADAEALVAHPRPHTVYSRIVSNQIKTENKKKISKNLKETDKFLIRTEVQKGKSSTGGTPAVRPAVAVIVKVNANLSS